VAALIERAAQSNPRLHGSQHTVPGYFLNGITPQGGQASTSFQTVFVMESTQDGLGHNLLINRNVVSAQFGPLLASP
jgi:hypothetical protein